MDLSDDLIREAERLGLLWQCSPALHPNDHLMEYVIKYSQRSVVHGPSGGLAEFFEHGADDAKKIKAIANRLGINGNAAVLEFASGYGRVSRHLSPIFPNVTCSDIHPDAVTFLRRKMRLKAVRSAANPTDFKPGRTYDFIFVLSLFSHLPEHLFGPWLGRLYALLNSGGALMFTTHGETASQKEPLLAQSLSHETGFGFLKMSDQPDLDPSVYGSSTALPDYVKRKIGIETQNEGLLLDFTPGAWWATQDEWIIQKPAAAPQRASGLARWLRWA